MNQSLPGGYAGKILRIDLTNERISTEALDAETCRKYVGGTGLGAKILYEEVPPEVTWDHPDNRLIMATGPLAGTPIWGTGTLSVVTKGALTNGATSTQANGFFGASLKYSGYDAIVLQGRAKSWVYVYIKDDLVELKDASHLLDKDTWETQDALSEEYGLAGHQMSVYGIGPAGENLVRFAIIEGDYGHVASKNGSGAVMGSKKVKCVCIVRGSRGVKIHDPAGLYAAADEMSYDLKTDPATRGFYEFGTLRGVVNGAAAGTLPTKNYTTNLYPSPEELHLFEAPRLRSEFQHRGHQCTACGMAGHCHMIVVPEGPHKGEIIDEPEYEGLAACGAQIGCTDPVAAAWLNTQVDRAGVDVNEWSWTTGWVMECMEKGYLTEEQVGLELKWGDAEAAYRLLQMIAHRQGFGDVLAEGVKRAAEKIGGPAYECAIFTQKGNSPYSHDHRTRWSLMLDACVSSAGNLSANPITHPTEMGLPARVNPFDGAEVAWVTGKNQGKPHFLDSLGICNFTSWTYLEFVARALSAVTGWEYTKEEAVEMGRRVDAIFRAFNLRCGIGPESEYPSPRYGSTPVDGPSAGQNSRDQWERMLDVWYETVGYDRKTGRPLPETLKQLGLEDLLADVWGAEAAAHV